VISPAEAGLQWVWVKDDSFVAYKATTTTNL